MAKTSAHLFIDQKPIRVLLKSKRDRFGFTAVKLGGQDIGDIGLPDLAAGDPAGCTGLCRARLAGSSHDDFFEDSYRNHDPPEYLPQNGELADFRQIDQRSAIRYHLHSIGSSSSASSSVVNWKGET